MRGGQGVDEADGVALKDADQLVAGEGVQHGGSPFAVGSARGERLQPQRALHSWERVRLWAVVGGARVPVREGRALGGGPQQPPPHPQPAPHALAVAARRRRSHSAPLTRTPTRTTTPRATALPPARNAPIPAARPPARIRGQRARDRAGQEHADPRQDAPPLLWCRGGAGGCRAGVVSAGFCSYPTRVGRRPRRAKRPLMHQRPKLLMDCSRTGTVPA